MTPPIEPGRTQLRHDPITNRWVIFSSSRSNRPTDFKSKSPQTSQPATCPFCIGQEHQCAPEIFRVPQNPDWRIRVIQNLYPALSRDVLIEGTELKDGNFDGFEVVSGFGFHDVVIECPVHSVQLCDLESEEIGEVVIAYRKRIEMIMECEIIKYIQVFKNHGASAGASMSHSHSQIIALPIIPPSVSARLQGLKEYFSKAGKCGLCDCQKEELLIDRSTHFVAIVPFAATYAFEIWIVPLEHSSHFHEIDREKAVDLGGLLKLMLKKIAIQLNNPPFNFMIQTSPVQIEESQFPYTHWFLQIIPQLTGLAGFEIATGCHINPVFPEDAAKVLREVNVPPEG